MERISKDRISRIWSLIVHKKGRSKYKSTIPSLSLFTGNSGGKTVGEYLYKENQIRIWWQPHDDFKDLASTILHEYTHYLQFWPWYSRYQKIYSYKDNPYEIQANESEIETPDYIKNISEDQWQLNLRKISKLKKIYEQCEELIEFNS